MLKLRKARDRKRHETGRCEGNPAWVKTVSEAVITAARTAQARGLSLRAIGVELAGAGLLNANGRTFAAQSVKRMLST